VVADLEQKGDVETGPIVIPGPPVPPPIGGGSEFLSRPVRDLELSIRSENCLLRGGIHTIGDLLQKTREDLLKIRNLGKISLKEIGEKLDNAGLKLREKNSKTPKED
jgi:DNA-directed RNA polymerase subunit alpha